MSELPVPVPDQRRSAPPTQSAVVELRQYTLHPGRRDELIELFDREFVETQEAEGMRVLGQFRDLDDPDRFVWLRGFADMDSRAAGLAAFYGGPVWAAHRDAANATMIDSDDVLLLRPSGPGPGLPSWGSADRLPRRGPASLVTVTVFPLRVEADQEFLGVVDRTVEPLLAARGSRRVAALQTEAAANNFPALPVREGEEVFVRVGRQEAGPVGNSDLPAAVMTALGPWLAGAPQHLRLAPTARSLLR